jgi:hypothetical protein
VAGSGWRGGVSVEGGSGGVVASSGAVLLLDAEARERIVGATSERRRKHSAGEKNPTGGGRSLLRGGGQGIGRCVGHSEGERGGPRRSGKWLGWLASAPGRRARAAALPQYSGRQRDARD